MLASARIERDRNEGERQKMSASVRGTEKNKDLAVMYAVRRQKQKPVCEISMGSRMTVRNKPLELKP